MKRRLIITVIIAIALAAGGWYGYSEYTRGLKDLRYEKPDAILTDEELIKAFEKDEKNANARYLGKTITVNGLVGNIEKDEMGYYTIVMGRENNSSSVRCSLDSLHADELASLGNLKNGAQLTIKGICTGFNFDELLGSDVLLNRCVIDYPNPNKQ